MDLAEIINNSIIDALKFAFIHIWYWFLIPLVFYIIQFYFARKYRVYSVEDFVYWLVSSIKARKGDVYKPLYLKGKNYPVDFTWVSPTEYRFGKLGSISFREGNNDRCFIFHLLTDAKGEDVRVQKIATLTSLTTNQVRVVLHELSKRLQNDTKLKPYFDVIATNEGAYKLAVKPTYSQNN